MKEQGSESDGDLTTYFTIKCNVARVQGMSCSAIKCKYFYDITVCMILKKPEICKAISETLHYSVEEVHLRCSVNGILNLGKNKI